MNEQDKEAFEKWYDSSLGTHVETWQAALEYERENTSDEFAIFAGEIGVDVSGAFDKKDVKNLISAQMENLKYDYEQERERSKKLVVHLEILIEVLADDCRSDEDCDHCWAVLALKEYRGEK